MNEAEITSTPSTVEAPNVQAGGYGTPYPQEASRTYSKTTFMVDEFKIVKTEYFNTGLIERNVFAGEKMIAYSRKYYDTRKERTVTDVYLVHNVSGGQFLSWFSSF